MGTKGLFTLLWLTLLSMGKGTAQRVYTPNSVLATGNWYRVGVKQEGIYKMDLAFLSGLGISTTALVSSSIRVYGNGGGMVPENNTLPRADDLVENAIEVSDGGDGVLNGSDYISFYAPGPDKWLKDSANKRFTHLKNLYSDTAFYYITIGGQGKRITIKTTANTPTQTVSSYNERYFYENNLVNLLNSGKEWYGEEFNNGPGGSSTRSFPVDWTGLLLSEPVTFISDLAARSTGGSVGFTAKVNAQVVQAVSLPAVSGNFLEPFASAKTQQSHFLAAQPNLAVSFTLDPVTGAQGWLNWFELHGRRSLAMGSNGILFFRDWQSVAPGSTADFFINNSSAASVWEVTDPQQPFKMNSVATGSQLHFSNDAAQLREYVAFTNAAMVAPLALGKINNQDLHHSSAVDLIIITHPTLLNEAKRLAAHHLQQDNYISAVITTDQVYKEFSGGSPDPAAIRDLVKMYYDKAGSNVAARPKYLLLFGSGSYDYHAKNAGSEALVPVYESVNSLDPLATYTSDDFFALLDDADDINSNNISSLLDIGVGRIPARDTTEARIMVDKIIRYQSAPGQGGWRNRSVFVADDKDLDLHLNDAETVSAAAAASNTLFDQYKIYLDAYPIVSSSSGARYPAVNDAIVSQLFKGTLLLNYNGHGSYQRLSEEAVLTQVELNRFNNADKLPLFITASCDFAPHDDPAKNSLGAGILTGGPNGAIALLTTTRLVFAYSNRLINENYLTTAFTPGANGQYLTLGESVKLAKNNTLQSSGDILNNRKFTLLGDPALRLSFPGLRLSLTAINSKPISGNDTLRALGKYTFDGTVTSATGNPVNDFTGTLEITVFDKAQQVRTLGNDAASPVATFTQQAGILYKGNASVTNGRFSFSFIVPKDINYQPGRGRISLYAANGKVDANGVNTSFYIGGAGNAASDITGPVIQPFLNDDQFKNAGLTNEDPLLLVKLSDSSGISTSGNGIGHDITAVIDGNEKDVLLLNDFYTASLDRYQDGQVLFQLPTQAEGKHSIRIKAWDVANNSSEATLEYTVQKQEKLVVTNVRNFPNPFTTNTTFGFEHNQPGKELDVTVTIFDRTGRMIKEIRQKVNTGGTRNCQINWAGDTQSGAKLTKGVYIYRVVVAAGSSMTESTQQLIFF